MFGAAKKEGLEEQVFVKQDREYLKKVEYGAGPVMWILTKYITC